MVINELISTKMPEV